MQFLLTKAQNYATTHLTSILASIADIIDFTKETEVACK